jgi:hypothetical protein
MYQATATAQIATMQQWTLRVLLFREGANWVAQCLDFDIAAQARTLEQVKAAFCRAFVCQVVIALEHKQEPLADMRPAPSWYAKQWEKAEPLANKLALTPPAEALPKDTPPAWMVHANAEMRLTG